MVRRRIKLYSYHTFLVVPFIVFFLAVHNPELTTIQMTYRTVGFGLLLTAILFALAFLVLRNRLKTGVYVTILLFTLFQYGVVYELFESLYYQGKWPFANIHRYLLVTYTLLLGGFLWFIRRSGHDFVRVNYFLNVLLAILITYNLLLAAIKVDYGSPRTITEQTPDMAAHHQGSSPNIYFIILDGYASGNVLRKYFSYDNTEFYSRLSGLGFTVLDSAYSNYYYTVHSLCGTLNLDYVKNRAAASAGIKDNRLFRILKARGYRIHHLYSGYAVSSSFKLADSTVQIDGPNEFEKSLLRHTILRLDDLFGVFAHQRLASQFEKMHELVATSGHPRFAFIHIVAPHPPYVFHRDGRIRTTHRVGDHNWEPRDHYVDQLIYVNKKITALLEEIRSEDPRATVIVQSDHGPWISAGTPEEVFEARSGMLYAYRSTYAMNVPERTSPVNTFRYLLNAVFDESYVILPDSAAGKPSLMKDPLFVAKVKR
jgi:hypothetical protein